MNLVIKNVIERARENFAVVAEFIMIRNFSFRSDYYKIIDEGAKIAPHETLFIGSGDPNNKGSKYQHITTKGNFIERTRKGGAVERKVCSLCIIDAYEEWESYARTSIASEVGVERSEVKHDFFGALRKVRHSFAHKNVKSDLSKKELESIGSVDINNICYDELKVIFERMFISYGMILDNYGIKMDESFSRSLRDGRLQWEEHSTGE